MIPRKYQPTAVEIENHRKLSGGSFVEARRHLTAAKLERAVFEKEDGALRAAVLHLLQREFMPENRGPAAPCDDCEGTGYSISG